MHKSITQKSITEPLARRAATSKDKNSPHRSQMSFEEHFIVEYIFCCQFTTNNKILDLLEDLATREQKCVLTASLAKYRTAAANPKEPALNSQTSLGYYKLYCDILKLYKIKDTLDPENGSTVNKWSSIRKKALKDLVLKKYIIEVKNKYAFSEETATRFKRDLATGLNFKNINDKNIHIQNSNITHIDGLTLYKHGYEWNFNIKAYNDPKKK